MQNLKRKITTGTIGKAIYKGPEARECWWCLHNGVSDRCVRCLYDTTLFEITDGDKGEFKRHWEYGTFEDRIKPESWTPEDQARYLASVPGPDRSLCGKQIGGTNENKSKS